ncbi:MAG: hypothetical protein UV95_C0001G0242 [Candidatus Falkowbacteria bacterium GW2011_GWF2_43_32]|nr:MAG: hypothetical protein UV95_C0001G0242 [Candidatus Falkowbacteria bacterium GW2011_GWF2_43_32]
MTWGLGASVGPCPKLFFKIKKLYFPDSSDVGVVRFELTIFWSQTRRLRPTGPHPEALHLVPRVRIELTTQRFSVVCSTTELPRQIFKKSCGGRTRTDDLQVMGLASCQLLYPAMIYVGNGGFEPPTSTLSVLRSNQLS